MPSWYDNSKAGENRRRKVKTRYVSGGQTTENDETHLL